MTIIQTPSLVRFISEAIPINSKQEFWERKPNSKKIREMAKTALLIEKINEHRQLDKEIDPQSVINRMNEPSILRNSEFRFIRTIHTNRKITIETEYFKPEGELYRVGHGTGAKVRVKQISKQYLVAEHKIENDNHYLKIANLSRLDTFLKKGKVAFHDVHFSKYSAVDLEVQPLTL